MAVDGFVREVFMKKIALGILGLFVLCDLTWAEGAPGVDNLYVDLYPAFIVNYGGKGRLRFFKTDVTVHLNAESSPDMVEDHLPFIRNNLVLLFSRQTEEALMTREGKEKLRQDALETVQSLLKSELGNETIDNLLFTSFIIQK
ncbi:MAG: hypothetical protein COB04_14690 [Gammaproteobacteria bacterium]|nr:MAG: hypothetical protein COB04_14690 [Gammaproteobacteria bacterium]